MRGSVWLPIIFCLVMMAVLWRPPAGGTLAACPPPTATGATGDLPDGGDRRWRQGAVDG
jgi:hypothetical protein